LGNKLKNGKDKIVGTVKEATGKFTDSNELELKGKLQTMKADIGNKADDVKEQMMGKANQIIDKVKDKTDMNGKQW